METWMKAPCAKADAFTWQEFMRKAAPGCVISTGEDAFADTVGRWFHFAASPNSEPTLYNGVLEIGWEWLARQYPRAAADYALTVRRPYAIDWFRILPQDVDGRGFE